MLKPENRNDQAGQENKKARVRRFLKTLSAGFVCVLVCSLIYVYALGNAYAAGTWGYTPFSWKGPSDPLVVPVCQPHPPCNQCLCNFDITMDPTLAMAEANHGALLDAGTAAKVTEFIAWADSILETVAVFMQKMQMMYDIHGDVVSSRVLGDAVLSKTTIAIADAEILAYSQHPIAKEGARRAMETGVSAGGADQFLCNVIKTRQALPAMEEFSRMVARIITEGIAHTYLRQDGNGPTITIHDALLKCGRVENFEKKTGNPIDAPPECQAIANLSGMGMDDFSIDARSLSRDNVYTLPPLRPTSQTVNGTTVQVPMFVPEAEDVKIKEAMDRWMAASQYCYTVAAFRPAPPYGVEQQTPTGMAKLKKYNECRAKQELFSYQCAYRLGKLTRPDCSDPDMVGFCLTGQEACLAARDAELNLGSDYKDCQNGLSLDQLEYVSMMLCGATRSVQSDILNNQSEGEKFKTLSRCAKAKTKWQEKLDMEEAAFQRSLHAADELIDCYQEVDKM